MQKRGIFFVFVLFSLILIPNVFSIYEESVYSGTVEEGDVINISNHIFEFRIDPISSKVFIEIDISGLIVASGECKIKDNFDICITNVSSTFKRDNITGLRIYKALLKVYQIKSKIDVTNTIEKNNILIDEETTAELSIENTADIVAEDVTATIIIPSSVLVTDLEGCKKTFESIVFKEDVYPTQIRKCTYKVKGLTTGDFELKANITFFDGIEKKSTASDTVSGKVYNYSLKIHSKLNKSKFGIGEKLNFTVYIENINGQYDLTVTVFNIKIPEKLLLVKRPRDTTGNNKLIVWSGRLAPNEKKTFAMEFQGLRTDNYSVATEASYKVTKFSRSTKGASNIEVYCDCPYIQHDLSKQITVPGQRVGLKAIITNPNSVNNFRNVKMSYITNIPNIQNFSTAYAEIKSFEAINIFDSSIIAPSLHEIYYFNMTVVYESQYDQFFVVKDDIIIKVPGREEEKIESVEEEKIEVAEEKEEVTLTQEKTEEVPETEEKETFEEETAVTVIKDEEKEPIKIFTIMVYIAALIFILLVLLIFKRKKGKVREVEQQESVKQLKTRGEKESVIKEFFSYIIEDIKEKIKRRSFGNKKEETDYEDLEKQIRELGNTPEKKK